MLPPGKPASYSGHMDLFLRGCILRDLICILVKWTLLAAVFTKMYSVNSILYILVTWTFFLATVLFEIFSVYSIKETFNCFFFFLYSNSCIQILVVFVIARLQLWQNVKFKWDCCVFANCKYSNLAVIYSKQAWHMFLKSVLSFRSFTFLIKRDLKDTTNEKLLFF